jgi:hypothetical protein
MPIIIHFNTKEINTVLILLNKVKSGYILELDELIILQSCINNSIVGFHNFYISSVQIIMQFGIAAFLNQSIILLITSVQTISAIVNKGSWRGFKNALQQQSS